MFGLPAKLHCLSEVDMPLFNINFPNMDNLSSSYPRV